ncbi:MAG: GMP/IMP nucleotidase [Acidiferrobacterales bacterium]
MISWQQVRTLLLDMDGTLLDLHYDNHFWLEHVPRRYAERYSLTIDDAKTALIERYREVEGSLDWYCVDFWTRELGLDIPALKTEVDHLITVRPYVIDFLDAARALGKRLVLVTNAHQKVLQLKMEHTGLERHFDTLISAHTMGVPKEQRAFWHAIQAIEPFEPSTTVFIDDSVPALRAARDYGIAQLLTITKPDSRQPEKQIDEFPAIRSFGDVIPC